MYSAKVLLPIAEMSEGMICVKWDGKNYRFKVSEDIVINISASKNYQDWLIEDATLELTNAWRFAYCSYVFIVVVMLFIAIDFLAV